MPPPAPDRNTLRLVWFPERRFDTSTMIFEVYDALKEAGATEDKAKKAAEALAAYENRFNKVEGDLNLLKWMVGFNLAMSVGILLKLFG